MPFLGVLVNTAAVLLGSSVGLIFKKGISKKMSQALMNAIGLCVIGIAVSGMVKGNALVAIVSMAIGTLLGTLLDIHHGIERLGDWINEKTKRGEDALISFSLYGYDLVSFSNNQGVWETCKLTNFSSNGGGNKGAD